MRKWAILAFTVLFFGIVAAAIAVGVLVAEQGALGEPEKGAPGRRGEGKGGGGHLATGCAQFGKPVRSCGRAVSCSRTQSHAGMANKQRMTNGIVHLLSSRYDLHVEQPHTLGNLLLLHAVGIPLHRRASQSTGLRQ